MAGNQLSVVGHQARNRPAELRHAGSNFRDLILPVHLCILGIGTQALKRPRLDLARCESKVHERNAPDFSWKKEAPGNQSGPGAKLR